MPTTAPVLMPLPPPPGGGLFAFGLDVEESVGVGAPHAVDEVGSGVASVVSDGSVVALGSSRVMVVCFVMVTVESLGMVRVVPESEMGERVLGEEEEEEEDGRGGSVEDDDDDSVLVFSSSAGRLVVMKVVGGALVELGVMVAVVVVEDEVGFKYGSAVETALVPPGASSGQLARLQPSTLQQTACFIPSFRF